MALQGNLESLFFCPLRYYGAVNAVGARVRDLPITPDKVLAALKKN
jgi:hypothetical protein